MKHSEEWLETREAAQLLGVCAKTVRMWGAAGRIAERQVSCGEAAGGEPPASGPDATRGPDASGGQDAGELSSAPKQRLYKRKDLEALLRQLHRPPPRGKRRR